ncbi:DUF4349 domain-containing protein [Streptomyces griseosporeus]|uniref:DUF4349 domain-containing protein n=1 Tax=Streptomyces griseosporeus TaxID=1910 RepID=UPI0036FCC47C
MVHLRTRRPVHALAGLLLATALALTACSGADDSGGASSADAKAAAPEGAAGGGARQATAAPQLPAAHVIRTASLTVQVKSVGKALADARTTAETAGGYVGEENTTRDEEGHEETRVVLRVPVERYDAVLTALQGAGKLLEREAKAQDVTDQVVDVDSRVKSARASVARVRELMDQATRLSDVVELEGELSRRQADLEALLARQASLKDRTSLATITLSLSETPTGATPRDDDPSFVDALAGGWDAFVTVLRWVVVVFGAVLPFAVALGLLVLGWVRGVRPRRRQAAGVRAGVLPSARTEAEAASPEETGARD